MRPTNRFLAITILLGSIILGSATAQMPRTISFQGVVSDQGVGIADGSHAFVFSIYDEATGGSPLFSEVQIVDVQRGVFNAVIGSVTPGGISSSLKFDRLYLLGISIDGGQELVPRTPMAAAPYSLHAAIADSLHGGVVRSINGLQGDIRLPAGGIGEITNSDGSIGVLNPTGPTVQLQVQDAGIGTFHLQNESVTAAKISTGGASSGKVLMSNGGATPVWSDPVAGDLILPYARTQTDTASLFSLTNSGTGRAASFRANNTNSITGVIEATTSGPGLVAKFSSTNTTAFAATAVQISSGGSSIGLQVFGGGGGGWFLPGYPGGVYAASGSGFAIQGSSTSGTGVYGGASTGTGVYAQARGTGNALIAVSESGGTSTTTTGNIALFKNTVNAGNVARISNTGRGYFNGGTQASGADVAESFDVEGPYSDYEPGDVLVVSTRSDRRVEKSTSPYSTAVVGVYATRPGVILSDRSIDESHDDRVPMGVLGVIPTKVTSENGAIMRGDLLVTSGTPGHAMKASPITLNGITFYPGGVIIGKALENFEKDGTGVIEVMVNAK